MSVVPAANPTELLLQIKKDTGFLSGKKPSYKVTVLASNNDKSKTDEVASLLKDDTNNILLVKDNDIKKINGINEITTSLLEEVPITTESKNFISLPSLSSLSSSLSSLRNTVTPAGGKTKTKRKRSFHKKSYKKSYKTSARRNLTRRS